MSHGRAILGIGTASFIPGYGLTGAEPAADPSLLDAVLSSGITYLDTAAIYADAESIIGGHGIAGSRRDVRLCTKVSIGPATSSVTNFELAVQQSLERLKAGHVDTVLLHSADAEVLRSPVLAEAFDAVKTKGWVRHGGASTYGAENAAVALEQSWCDVLQIEYSILNQSVLESVLRAPRRCEVVARSVLCKGLLTDQWKAARFAAAMTPALEALSGVAREWNENLTRLAIRFALDTAGVDVVLVGVRCQAELDEALAAASAPPLTVAQKAVLAGFDRSTSDHVHPERWSHV